MKHLQFGFLFLLVIPITLVYSWSRETHLSIENLRNVSVIEIKVTDVDSFDFENGNDPETIFKDVQIPAKESVDGRLEVNQLAHNSPFTMDLIYEDGQNATFRINQKFALGDSNSNFSYIAPYRVTYEKIGNVIFIKVGENVHSIKN